MKRLIPLLLLAACSQPAPQPAPAQPEPAAVAPTPTPVETPAPTPASSPTPNSPEEAVQIARDYLAAQHPGQEITLGEPGPQDGAAGSIYMEIPATIGGAPATVIMRRVNNVDGSTAEQRRWHVERVDQK